MKLFRFSTTVVLTFLCLILSGQTLSPFIHVDQFGYRSSDEKVAVLSNPIIGYNADLSYAPGELLELRNAQNDEVVMNIEPSPWGGGATHEQSGDQGWWLDFSNLTTTGSYYIYDPSNEERSPTFEIKESMYQEVLQASMRMFYYNRCNFPKNAPYAESGWTDGMDFLNDLQDGNCRSIFDQENSVTEKDLHGGWYDAGDYNKYVTFVNETIHNLLWAYQENPTVFGDNWNIPESGNGIPDVLDELKWELDWLLRMNNEDGSTHLKMGSKNYSENVAAPPSANTDPRYYGPTCSSASIAIASMLSHAAIVFSDFPSMDSFVADLTTSAEKSWDYVLPLLNNNNLDTDCDNGEIISGDADWTVDEQTEAAVVAAIHLFDLTGNSAYNTYVVNHANNTSPLQDSWWSGYKQPLNDALMHYTTLAGANTTLSATIRNSITLVANNNWNDFFGFSNNDLYRSYMPDWSYHWGSNFPKAGFGLLNKLLVKYEVNPANAANYDRKALEQLHYFHGVNPNGLVYLSNMYDLGGDRCVNEIYHTWFNDGTDWDNSLTSSYGPAPGYMSGGANSSFSISTLSPPAGEPDQKSYLDFNDGFPSNSWEISEPSQKYQGAYVRHLAWYAGSADISLSVDLISFEADCIEELQRIVIEWQTANERNNAYFLLEKSENGRQWSTIKKVSGLENSAVIQHYFFEDIHATGQRNYYRLKQVDTDGTFQYSNILSASCLLENSIRITPNPTVGYLQVASKLNDYRIEVSDLSGRKLLNRAGSRNTTIDLSNFSNGVYQVSLLDKNGQSLYIKKIIKRNE